MTPTTQWFRHAATAFVFSLGFFLSIGAALGQTPGTITLNSGWLMQDIAQVKESGEVVSTAAFTPAVYMPIPYVLPPSAALYPTGILPRKSSGWPQAPGPTSTAWYKATVPGTVLTTLVDNKIYPDPLYGENDRPTIIPDSLCRTSYWYRNQVTVPADYANKHVWLNFEGINYIADVWVNGHNAGSIRGAFTRGNFDITPFVKPGDTATIAVLIHPPLNPNDPNEHMVALTAGRANGVGPNGGVESWDGPSFICSQGWNWIFGIRDRNMGLWQKVTLSATGNVQVQNPYVVSDLALPAKDSADLTVEVTLRNLSNTPQMGELLGQIKFIGALGDPPSGLVSTIQLGQIITLQPNETRTVKFTPAADPQLHVTNPHLWWPNGLGKANLYALQLNFYTGDFARNGDAGASLSDIQATTFGIRKITYQLPGSDNLALSVNGVPVMADGGDWGMDEAMKRIPRDRLEAQIRLHQLANFNIIRNWVGQSTGEDFYDLCDRYGLMVWDEFFQPNQSDSGRGNGIDATNDIQDIPMYLANSREKVLRFRNHPSIVLWCGRNESDPSPPAVADGLKAIMAELDPSRYYQANSSAGGGVSSGGPYSWRPPASYYTFTETGPRPEIFKTEIGLGVSMPTLEAVHAMIPEKDWETVNQDWAQHNFTQGTQGGDVYPSTMTTRYGAPGDLADFVRVGQLANYEAARALFEGRQAKMFKPATGTIDWMSNPTITSFTYQMFSHDLEPDATLFGARAALDPVHVQMNQKTFHLMVINHTPDPLTGLTATVRLFNLDGTKKYDHTWPVTAPGATATDVGDLTAVPEFASLIGGPDGLSKNFFIKVELHDAQNHLVSQGFYWEALATNAGDFTSLKTMPTVTLDAKITRHDANGNCLLDVTLTNPSPQNVAVMAHLQLRNNRTNDRILPVYYTDNYISLLAGESRTITIEAASKDLGNDQPLVVLDGWNVTTKPQTFPANGGASLAPNTPAMQYTAAKPFYYPPLP